MINDRFFQQNIEKSAHEYIIKYENTHFQSCIFNLCDFDFMCEIYFSKGKNYGN